MNNTKIAQNVIRIYVYEDGSLSALPRGCAMGGTLQKLEVEEAVVAIDTNGNRMADGDTVTLIRNLKVKVCQRIWNKGTRVKISVS